MQRAFNIVRTDGWLSLGFRILGQTAYRRLLVFETNLVSERFSPDTRCRWLQRHEASAYAVFSPAVLEAEVHQRLDRGERCWIFTAPTGEIAHALWVATGAAWIDYLGQHMPLERQAAYLYQSFTAPPYRGQRFATVALRALKHTLHIEGITRTVSCILPHNTAAYPPAFRGGAHPVAYIGWIGCGPWRRSFRRPTHRLPWYAPQPTGP